MCVVRRILLVFGSCRVPTCYNRRKRKRRPTRSIRLGLLASILSRLLAADLAARHSEVCLSSFQLRKNKKKRFCFLEFARMKKCQMGASGRGKRYRKYLCVYVRLLAYYIHITRARAHTKYIVISQNIYHLTTSTPLLAHQRTSINTYIHTIQRHYMGEVRSVYVFATLSLTLCYILSLSCSRSLSLSLWFSLSIWLARSLARSLSLALSLTYTWCSSATASSFYSARVGSEAERFPLQLKRFSYCYDML